VRILNLGQALRLAQQPEVDAPIHPRCSTQDSNNTAKEGESTLSTKTTGEGGSTISRRRREHTQPNTAGEGGGTLSANTAGEGTSTLGSFE
jgi:hypothetical protein